MSRRNRDGRFVASFRTTSQTRIDCGRGELKIAAWNVNFDRARACVVSRAAKAGKWVTYTARSGSRVNEEDDDTGLGEFRDGARVFNSFVTRSYIFFFFWTAAFFEGEGSFWSLWLLWDFFLYLREKLKWRISCFLIDVENIFWRN